ncbi:MAG: hypothetical protein M1822_003119 [Bathelium mastoideum]|nr:MAG: hypothetical protein M1822_003119 [Bathelium mastoideum]
MLSQEPAARNSRKRGHADETPSLEPRELQPAICQRREQTPPAFWNKLSHVPLCRRALREFDRRTTRTTPTKRPDRVQLTADLTKRLKRFARRGGPDCQDIIAYPERHESSNQASKMPTTLSSKDAAFKQCIIDNKILPPDYEEVEYSGIEQHRNRMERRRSSLSPSRYPREKFVEFKRANAAATSEADVMKNVIPKIAKSVHNSISQRSFSKLASMTNEETKLPKPDLYEGSRPVELKRVVRDKLSQYIIPSARQDEMLLPNHFTEVKGPDGNPSEMILQATYDAAHGTRGMHEILSYGKDEQQYDAIARCFASTYHSALGSLNIYASHVTAPTEPEGDPTYRTTLLNGYNMVANYDMHRAGLAAYRNVQDLAKEQRDKAIAYVKNVIPSNVLDTIEELPSASTATSASAISSTTASVQTGSDQFSNKPSLSSSPPVKRSSQPEEASSSFPKRRRRESM